MELNPLDLTHRNAAKLMLGLVVPRPIAVVSSLSTDGFPNIASFSYFNVVSDYPMALSFSITGPKPDGSMKDTLRNVRPPEQGGLGEYVINVATEYYAKAVARSGKSLPYGQSEFDYAGLTPAASRSVRAPRIAEALASFECRTHTIVEIGEAHLVIGLVTRVWITDDIVDSNMRIDIKRLKPIARLAGSQYCRVNDIFEMSMD